MIAVLVCRRAEHGKPDYKVECVFLFNMALSTCISLFTSIEDYGNSGRSEERAA